MPHLRIETQADRTPEERLRALHSRGGSPDRRGGKDQDQGIAVDMLYEDMQHFESMSPKASERELQEQCHETVHEYEDSMLV